MLLRHAECAGRRMMQKIYFRQNSCFFHFVIFGNSLPGFVCSEMVQLRKYMHGETNLTRRIC